MTVGSSLQTSTLEAGPAATNDPLPPDGAGTRLGECMLVSYTTLRRGSGQHWIESPVATRRISKACSH